MVDTLDSSPMGSTSTLPRSRHVWLLAVLLVVSVLTLGLQTSSLPGFAAVQRAGKLRGAIEFWRRGIVNGTKLEGTVSEEDLLHLSLLHEACVTHSNISIPWVFGSPGHQLANASASNPEQLTYPSDADLLRKLRNCPDVDIYLPEHLHGNGYCEDAVAYAKYLESRLLPLWALEIKLFDPELGREVDYFELCPTTPVIFFNHYWDDLPNSPRWPKNKPVYLMPNIEMFELTAESYWRVDTVLCKTIECYDRVTRWYDQEGNPKDTPVFYTKHTSSDQASFARRRMGSDAIAPKNFSTVKFLHTAGASGWKGTRQLVDCWTSTPDLPPLDVYIARNPFSRLFPGSYTPRLQESKSPVNIHVGIVEHSKFTKMTAEAAFIMCPSMSEGYGHYLNQARASGAVVVTTDVPPMNELISNETGVLISAGRLTHPKVLLGGAYKGKHGLKNVEGHIAAFTGDDVCKAVKDMLKATTEQHAAMGANARRQYHQDTLFFAQAMQKLRKFARSGGSSSLG